MEEKTLTIKKDTLWKAIAGIFAVLFIISLVWNPFKGEATGDVITGDTTGEIVGEPEKLAGSSFFVTGDSVCKDADGNKAQGQRQRQFLFGYGTQW